MKNFSIGIQIKKELQEFNEKKVLLASTEADTSGVRILRKNASGYYFNQREAISLVDLYYNSKFESGPHDGQGQRKMFLNIGKFRCEVSSKQIELDTKDFRFIPDPYADPWTAYFLQKDFQEWAEDSLLAELINECVEALPKYGSVVLKKVGKSLVFVPLQNLKNQQTAKDLETATYVIEEHPDMHIWEMEEMKGWSTEGLTMRIDETLNVFERYGRVPLGWLKKINQEKDVTDKDWTTYVDAMVIMAYTKNDMRGDTPGQHIFFAEQVRKRPYRECHWSKQHGRWLGLGVMEDLVENQRGKNIVINLIRKSMQWSGKRVLQSASDDIAGKNLVRDVEDGEILDVGANGAITSVDLGAKTNADFTAFLAETEKNADQKAFTYEVATGESLGDVPFRLGVLLTNAVQSFFGWKKQKLALFIKRAVVDFMVPQFLADMDDKEKVIAMFPGDAGFEALKAAAMDMVKIEAVHISLLSGKPVDAQTLTSAVEPWQAVQFLLFPVTKDRYKNAKYKYTFVTGEEVDLKTRLATLTTIYQSMVQTGDSRAEKVLELLASLGGENIQSFGPKVVPVAPANSNTATPGKPSPYQKAALPA